MQVEWNERDLLIKKKKNTEIFVRKKKPEANE
jgi:hypothetical protein